MSNEGPTSYEGFNVSFFISAGFIYFATTSVVRVVMGFSFSYPPRIIELFVLIFALFC